MQEQEKNGGNNANNDVNNSSEVNQEQSTMQDTVQTSASMDGVNLDFPEVMPDVISQLEAKVLELQDAFMRAKAEADNVRRRAQEDISKAHKFAIENFAESMVPVKDSLEMGLKIESASVEAIKEGVEVTLKQLNAAFEKNRLFEVNPPKGEKLDPTKHQAVSVVPADQEANTIVEVLQKGYMIADRLLRPALVTVAASK